MINAKIRYSDNLRKDINSKQIYKKKMTKTNIGDIIFTNRK